MRGDTRTFGGKLKNFIIFINNIVFSPSYILIILFHICFSSLINCFFVVIQILLIYYPYIKIISPNKIALTQPKKYCGFGPSDGCWTHKPNECISGFLLKTQVIMLFHVKCIKRYELRKMHKKMPKLLLFISIQNLKASCL